MYRHDQDHELRRRRLQEHRELAEREQRLRRRRRDVVRVMRETITERLDQIRRR